MSPRLALSLFEVNFEGIFLGLMALKSITAKNSKNPKTRKTKSRVTFLVRDVSILEDGCLDSEEGFDKNRPI